MKIDISIIRQNRSNVTLVVNNGNITAYVPFGVSMQDIIYIVESHRDWIIQRLTRQNRAPKVDFQNKIVNTGNSIDQNNANWQEFSFKQIKLFGKMFDIANSNSKRTFIEDNKVYLYTINNSYDCRRDSCKKLVKSICMEKIPVLSSVIFSKIGVCPCGINVNFLKSAKTKGLPNEGIQHNLSSIRKNPVQIEETSMNRDNWVELKANRVYFDAQVVQLPSILQRYIVVSAGLMLITGFSSDNYLHTIKNLCCDVEWAESQLANFSYLKELFS